jgi:hypothetical protein
MPDKADSGPGNKGPLHLQRHLTTCTEALEKVLRQATAHPLTGIFGLYCHCGASGKYPLSRKAFEKEGTIEARTAQARKRLIESSRRMTPAASEASPPGPDKPASLVPTPERREICRFFDVRMNDESAIIHAFCRRCEQRIVVYDRDLYWGTKRQTGITPPTYPYRCSCGGHMFEVAVGFDYPDEAIDENDINTITIAVRCVGCGEEAMIFDDEAT